MNIFKKFDHIKDVHSTIVKESAGNPLSVAIEKVYSPTLARISGRDCVLLGTNNYLGLTFDEEAIQAAHEATKFSGIGTTGSRVANGSFTLHQMLEQQIAEFFERKKAILFTTGYQANVGFLSAMGGKDDVILIDSESHASIYDGCKLSNANILHFRHNNPSDLEKRLRRLSPDTNKLVVTEGIFSMRGDRAPLAEIAEVSKKHDAYVMVDEAHSLGVLGENGRGLAEAEGVEADVDFIVGTFSKSVGTIGGFCTSNHEELETVRLALRSYLFTASLPPSIVAAASVTLARIKNEPALRRRLWANTDLVYDGLMELGFDIGPHRSPVIGVFMPSLKQGLKAWQMLMDEGVYVNMVLPPAAPENTCLLRCSVSAAHTEEQVSVILNAFSNLKDWLYPSLKSNSATK